MASKHRARVCAVGTADDMSALLRAMLANCNALPSEEDRLPFTLEELIRMVQTCTHENGDEMDTFLYEMVSGIRYGSAEPGTCRLNVRQEKCGLWTACFAYDSASEFQPHEWRSLHRQCGQILMVAQRASWDFALDKGEMIFTGGEILDNWDGMNECWLWLIPQYECGYPPEEAVSRLEKLQRTLEREDADTTVDELLRSCMDNLTAIAMEVEDSQALIDSMTACAARQDFVGLLEAEHMIAESVLWETEHNAKWLACLESVRCAWQAHLRGE